VRGFLPGRRARWLGAGLALACGVLLVPRAGGTGGEADETAAGPERNASQWPGTQAEISLAVDRFRPETAVVAAMSVDDGRMLVLSTADAGETWSRAPLPLGVGATLDADPWVAFDSRGRAYLARIPVINGNYNLGIDVSHSDDAGASWSPTQRISQAINDDDKLALTADDEPDSPYRDNVYVVWKRHRSGPYFSRSTDLGQTFSAPRGLASGSQYVTGEALATAADGTLYLAYRDYSRSAIRVMTSPDGGASFSPPVTVSGVRAGFFVIPPSCCQRKALVHASVGVDRSAGPNRGDVYVAWSDYPPGISDTSCKNPCSISSPCIPSVYFSRSSNRGLSWSAPEVVHESLPGVVDRYLPWLGVDPSDGSVFVAYKDSRNFALREASDVYLSRSADGGRTWDPSVRVSSAAAEAENAFQFGDYQSLAAASGLVYVAWADYRDDPYEAEVYVRAVHANGEYPGPPRRLRPPPPRPGPPHEVSRGPD
jgi:hypothetical protein